MNLHRWGHTTVAYSDTYSDSALEYLASDVYSYGGNGRDVHPVAGEQKDNVQMIDISPIDIAPKTGQKKKEYLEWKKQQKREQQEQKGAVLSDIPAKQGSVNGRLGSQAVSTGAAMGTQYVTLQGQDFGPKAREQVKSAQITVPVSAFPVEMVSDLRLLQQYVTLTVVCGGRLSPLHPLGDSWMFVASHSSSVAWVRVLCCQGSLVFVYAEGTKCAVDGVVHSCRLDHDSLLLTINGEVPLQCSELFTARYRHSVSSHGGVMYVSGGRGVDQEINCTEDNSTNSLFVHKDVIKFGYERGNWVLDRTWHIMDHARHSHASSILVIAGVAYLIMHGGAQNGSSTSFSHSVPPLTLCLSSALPIPLVVDNGCLPCVLYSHELVSLPYLSSEFVTRIIDANGELPNTQRLLLVGGCSPVTRTFTSVGTFTVGSKTPHFSLQYTSLLQQSVVELDTKESVYSALQPEYVHSKQHRLCSPCFTSDISLALFARHTATVVKQQIQDDETTTTILLQGGGGLCFTFGTYYSPTFLLTVKYNQEAVSSEIRRISRSDGSSSVNAHALWTILTTDSATGSVMEIPFVRTANHLKRKKAK